MYDIDHGINLKSTRVTALIELMDELANINKILITLEEYDNFLNILSMNKKFISDLHFSNLESISALKKCKLFTLLRIKYLKETKFDIKFKFTKNYNSIYILTNGRNSNMPDVPRIRTSLEPDVDYLKQLFETNLVYLLLKEPEWLDYIREDKREFTQELIGRLKRAIDTKLVLLKEVK